MSESLQEEAEVPRPETAVLFNWQISSYFGWGVYGLNLMLAWADRCDLRAATLWPIIPDNVDVDPLELRRILPAARRSHAIQAELQRTAGPVATSRCLVLQSLQNGMDPCRGPQGVLLRGSTTVGVAFLEFAPLDREAAARLQDYPLIVAGSTWNQQLMEDAGARRVELVIQGLDTSHFHPAPKRNLFPGRFVVFSGGKLEHRKGQDLVLRAFRIFAARHTEALLLTAWHSPWPQAARTIAADEDLLPPPFTADGRLDVGGWTRSNGIPDEQVVHCGAVPNRSMARIVREADVALFPNRAEGGTNLVAMECMACAVPVILSANTGHLDLLHDGTAIGLQQQRKVPGASHAGWGESDVEEMVAGLESVFRDREGARARAQQGAANISHFTWTAQMEKLATLLLPLMPKA